jgi:hypothetical protein
LEESSTCLTWGTNHYLSQYLHYQNDYVTFGNLLPKVDGIRRCDFFFIFYNLKNIYMVVEEIYVAKERKKFKKKFH